jgi:transcriptional regulator with XRE-family HTH domain
VNGLLSERIVGVASHPTDFIWQLETGKERNPSVTTLFGIARALDVSPLSLAAAAFEDIAGKTT